MSLPESQPWQDKLHSDTCCSLTTTEKLTTSIRKLRYELEWTWGEEPWEREQKSRCLFQKCFYSNDGKRCNITVMLEQIHFSSIKIFNINLFDKSTINNMLPINSHSDTLITKYYNKNKELSLLEYLKVQKTQIQNSPAPLPNKLLIFIYLRIIFVFVDCNAMFLT